MSSNQRINPLKAAGNILDFLNESSHVRPGNISLLEKPINPSTQLEYYRCAQNHENDIRDEEVIQKKELIFSDSISLDEKKILLVQLASLSHVEAYRTIEKYLHKPGIKLYEWAYLAWLESKMLLESDLLEESQMLITSGLGAKGNKLRYFIVFFTEDGTNITELQQKIIRNELHYAFKCKSAEIENISFQDGFAAFTAVVPYQIPVQEFFLSIVQECNEFGTFLFNDYIITNVKVLSVEEIYDVLAENNIV